MVTISGTNFTGATSVTFGGIPATNVIVVSSTQITAITPAGTGTVDAIVTTPYGTSAIVPADQYTYTSVPVVAAVSPLTSPLAGNTTVTIAGMNFTGATDVYFGAIDVPLIPSMINPSGTVITLTNPASVAGTVDVTVVSPNGTSAISAADRFTYGTGPIVAGLSTASGPIAGGTAMTITGANFTGATDVYFGAIDVPLVAGMINLGGTAITLTSPAGAAGTTDVTVVSPNGTSTLSSADQFTYFSLPVVNVMYPDRGPVAGSTYVSITGSGLANALSVNFGTHAATILSDTDTQIIVLSPAATGNSPGTVAMTVTTPHGTSATQTFTYILPPAVTSIVATSGPSTGGTTVAITGTNLSGVSGVFFGGIPAATFSINHGQIIAVSPPGDISIVDVQVVTGGGMSIASPADQFTYVIVRPPIVVSINTTLAARTGGNEMVITGTALGNATAVNFGSLSARIISNTETQIVVATPASADLSAVDVTVVTDGGTSETSPDDQVAFVAAPSVTSISVSSGFRSGGQLVTIYGSNLDSATEVDFGGNAGVIVDESAEAIDVHAPAGTPGTVPVTVITPGGTSAGSKSPSFTYLTPPPSVLGLSATNGPAAGGTAVTITGTDLDGATEVDFGTARATIVSDTSTTITVTSPAIVTGGSGTTQCGGTVDVTVITAGGTSSTSLSDQFTGIAPPTVSSVVGQASQSGGSAGTTIAAGPLSGGTDVLINGSGLAGATAVKFAAVAGTIVVDSDAYIEVLSPTGVRGTVDVTVTTPYGTSTTLSADQFTYVAAPVAMDDSYATTAESTLTVPANSGVLANDADPQSLPLTATLVTEPANGTLSFNSDGSFTYTPNNGYLGSDSFTYQTTNGYVTSSTNTVAITVASSTMEWIGSSGTGSTGSTGNWTDPQWTSATSTLPYPDATVTAVIDSPSVVQVTSNQTVYALTLSNGGEVSVGPGAVLTVLTNFSITGGGTLNVDANGAFYVDGTVSFNSASSLSGGPISAAGYQLNDGTVSANLGGPGGVTVGSVTVGSGTGSSGTGSSPEPDDNVGRTVTLSGTNTYAGGTTVNSGLLVIDGAAALPAGTSLTIGGSGSTPSALGHAVSAPATVSRVGAPSATTVAVPMAFAAIVVAATTAPMLPAATVPSTLSALVQPPATIATQSNAVFKTAATHDLATRANYGLTFAAPIKSTSATDAVFKAVHSDVGHVALPGGFSSKAVNSAWFAPAAYSSGQSDQDLLPSSNSKTLDKLLARFGI